MHCTHLHEVKDLLCNCGAAMTVSVLSVLGMTFDHDQWQAVCVVVQFFLPDSHTWLDGLAA